MDYPFATVIFNEQVYGLAAAVIQGHPDIAVLMHGSSVFIDLAFFKGHGPVAYRTNGKFL